MALNIAIYSDFVCPFCYIGSAMVDKLQHEPDIELNVTWLPFELHPGTPEEGIDIAEYMGSSPESIQQMHDGLKERAAEYDLPIDPPTRLYSSRKAHLLSEYARDQGKINELIPLLFKANFLDRQNLADPEVLRNASAQVGLDPDAATDALENPEYEERLQQAMTDARRYEITGVPGFIIEGQYRVVGAIPYEQMVEALRQIQQAPV